MTNSTETKKAWTLPLPKTIKHYKAFMCLEIWMFGRRWQFSFSNLDVYVDTPINTKEEIELCIWDSLTQFMMKNVLNVEVVVPGHELDIARGEEKELQERFYSEVIESFNIEEQDPITDVHKIELIFGDTNHQSDDVWNLFEDLEYHPQWDLEEEDYGDPKEESYPIRIRYSSLGMDMQINETSY